MIDSKHKSDLRSHDDNAYIRIPAANPGLNPGVKRRPRLTGNGMGLIGGPANLPGGGKGNLRGGGNGGLPMPGCCPGNPNIRLPGAILVMKFLIGGKSAGACCTALSALLTKTFLSFNRKSFYVTLKSDRSDITKQIKVGLDNACVSIVMRFLIDSCHNTKGELADARTKSF